MHWFTAPKIFNISRAGQDQSKGIKTHLLARTQIHELYLAASRVFTHQWEVQKRSVGTQSRLYDMEKCMSQASNQPAHILIYTCSSCANFLSAEPSIDFSFVLAVFFIPTTIAVFQLFLLLTVILPNTLSRQSTCTF